MFSFRKKPSAQPPGRPPTRTVLLKRDTPMPGVPPAQQWGWALLDARDDVFAALRGVAVNSVEEGGAAARSGVAPGDVIHAVAGRNLESLSDFKSAMVEAFLTGSLELELEVSQQREQVTLWWERTEGAEELARREAEQLSLAMAESEASATPQGGGGPPGADARAAEEEAALAAAIAESSREAGLAPVVRPAQPSTDSADDEELQRALAESSRLTAEQTHSAGPDEASARALAAEEEAALAAALAASAAESGQAAVAATAAAAPTISVSGAAAAATAEEEEAELARALAASEEEHRLEEERERALMLREIQQYEQQQQQQPPPPVPAAAAVAAGGERAVTAESGDGYSGRQARPSVEGERPASASRSRGISLGFLRSGGRSRQPSAPPAPGAPGAPAVPAPTGGGGGGGGALTTVAIVPPVAHAVAPTSVPTAPAVPAVPAMPALGGPPADPAVRASSPSDEVDDGDAARPFFASNTLFSSPATPGTTAQEPMPAPAPAVQGGAQPAADLKSLGARPPSSTDLAPPAYMTPTM